MKSGSSPITFLIRAERALFTRPDLRVERFTYPVPTFGALAGVLRSIYAKPAFYWVPSRVLIMKPIRYQNIMINEVRGSIITTQPFIAPDRRIQKMQTYLYDVQYIIEAHFKWSGKEPNDENLGKHLDIFRRSLEAGGRRDVYLGTRECSAIVEPIGQSFDDFVKEWRQTNSGLDLDVGMMFYGWEWGAGNEGTDNPTFCKAQVRRGVLEYPHPDDPEQIIHQQFFKGELS